ncbi:MAG TPA: 5'-nucleotidase, lipoprotein e(P4) family [Candidatus Acidoferrum sp.]|nr:5'-nucleotidase, lipoprotein e(P4) family [Candidatus Acidoferrum sp.]
MQLKSKPDFARGSTRVAIAAPRRRSSIALPVGRTCRFASVVLALTLLAMATGCRTASTSDRIAEGFAMVPPYPGESGRMVSEQTVLAVLWYQRAAECRALYYQACNIARERIDQYLLARRNTVTANPRKAAIIVDIDETVLDNSEDGARYIATGTVYTTNSWAEWVRATNATVLPGMLSLLRHCKTNDVEVFYVSNRETNDDGMAHALANLISQGLPYADTNHVFLHTSSSAKDDRRGPLMTNGLYDVILLMGDNLGDFHHDYDAKVGEDKRRKDATDRDATLFGSRYIVLPNPIYGTWESVFYDKTATNKSTVRKEELRVFKPGERK